MSKIKKILPHMRSLLFVFFLVLLTLCAANPLQTVSDAYADTHASRLFTRLSQLLDTAHGYKISDLAPFADVLASDCYYVHQGRGTCHGLKQVVGCLLREWEEEDDGSKQQHRETLAHGPLYVVRQVTEVRRGGSEPSRTLDVFFVRAHNEKIVLLERMPTVKNPLMVEDLLDKKK